MKELTKTIAETKTGEMVKSWRQDVMECNNSGKRVSQWCKENGIALSTYYNRLRRVREYVLTERETEEEKQSIVSVQIPCAEEIRIRSGEIEIMLPEKIGAEQLRAVVSALKRC